MTISFNHAKKIAIVFLIVYAVIGFVGHISRSGIEDWYPFFSWSLFAEVPPLVQTDFDARIVAVNGSSIEPTPFEKLPEVFGPINDSKLKFEIQQIGHFFIEKNPEAMNAHVQALVPYFHQPATFEVRAITFDVIEHFKTGAVLKTEPLQRFDITAQ